MVTRVTVKPGETIKDEKGEVVKNDKGEEQKKPDEVVGSKLIERRYSEKCSSDRVTRELLKANSTIIKADIEATSMALVTVLKSPNISTEGFQKIIRAISENLASQDDFRRKAQLAAMQKVGITEEFVRAQAVQCRMVEQADVSMVFDCN